MTKDIAVDPKAIIAWPLRSAPILFQCQEKGKNKAEKGTKSWESKEIYWWRFDINSIDGQEGEEECQKNQTRFILPPREFADFFKRLPMSLSFNWKGDGYDWKSRPAETNWINSNCRHRVLLGDVMEIAKETGWPVWSGPCKCLTTQVIRFYVNYAPNATRCMFYQCFI